MWDALRNFVPFTQFKKREKHPWKSVTFIKVEDKSNTPPWVFFTFFKLYKWYQITQSIAYEQEIRRVKMSSLSLMTIYSRLYVH